MDVTNEELILLKAINHSHRGRISQPAHLRDDARALIARGLVAECDTGLYVPDDVKFKFLADGQSLGR